MVIAKRRFAAAAACAVAALSLVAYANSFPIGFHFDDTYGIALNPAVRSLANVPRYFVDPFLLTTFRDNVDVRPLLQATFALNYAVSALSPWSWHVFNLLVHVAASLLVFFLVRDHVYWPREERGLGAARWVAAAAAIFFAVSPLNQQAVVYMWARSALLCTALYLAAFLAHLKGRPALAAALFLLALLTKTIAVTLPLVIVVYHLLEGDLRRVLKPLALMGGVLVAFLIYRAAVLPAWADATRHEKWATPPVWLMSQWTAYLYYPRLYLWPDALSVDHDFAYNFSLLSPRTLLSLAGVVIWLGAALKLARRQPTFAFATAWYFITLAPESTLAPLAEVINDHRPYLASALGLSLLFAWALWTLAARLVSRPELALSLAAAAACAAAVPAVRQRNFVWQDGARLWIDAAEKGPRNGRAAMNAGRELMARGRLREARQWFDRARAVTPDYAFLHINYSVLEANEGRTDAAIVEARRAVELAPQLGQAHEQLGLALAKAGRQAEARASFERALSFEPSLEESRRQLGADPDPAELLMRQGLDELYARNDPRAAAADFEKVLARNPEHYGASYQLAVALDRQGRGSEARALWEKVLAMAEGYHDAQTAQTARARLQSLGAR